MNISESRPISQHYRVIDSDYDIILLVTPNDNVVKPEDWAKGHPIQSLIKTSYSRI